MFPWTLGCRNTSYGYSKNDQIDSPQVFWHPLVKQASTLHQSGEEHLKYAIGKHPEDKLKKIPYFITMKIIFEMIRYKKDRGIHHEIKLKESNNQFKIK